MAGFIDGVLGTSQVRVGGLADATELVKMGTRIQVIDDYWGGLELVYVRFTAATSVFGVVTLSGDVSGGRVRTNATAVANTANLGRSVGISLVKSTAGDTYGWVVLAGTVPVNATASIAAAAAFGIAAAGQAGAIANGKQILNAVGVLPSSTTVAKANTRTQNGSYQLQVSGADGWFVGCALSGTGIPAATTVTDISPDGRTVTMNNAATASGSVTVTGTYNDGTAHYPVVHVEYPFAQGQIV